MANKKRKQKISGGTAVGSKSVKLSELDKVLMGKGILDSFKPAPAPPRKQEK